MKIIKEGKIPEIEIPKVGLFYRGKCKNCGCEFEAHENEFYKDTIVDSIPTVSIAICCYNTKETNLYVDCPTCKKKIKIKNLERETEAETWSDNFAKYSK